MSQQPQQRHAASTFRRTDQEGVSRRQIGYQAECSCGWLGPMHLTWVAASRDAQEHEKQNPQEAAS